MNSSEPEGKASEQDVERRAHVSLLFSDLCDYTALNELIDPEEANELRRRIESLCQRVISAHQGHINQFVGDGMLAVFGFPDVDEAGIQRAVEATLELHDEIRRLEWPALIRLRFKLQLHSGIHSGVVFVRKGDPRHGRYELTGDAVNTAARLCAAASRDEILVSEAALQGIEALFEVEPVTPLQLKGKQRPVPAYRVRGRTNAETRFDARSRRGLTPFIGRSKELEVLERSFAKARSGEGTVQCVLGDAGVGKTRLLDELRRRAKAAGARVCSGSCESYGGSAPLRPFLQVVRNLVAVPSETEPEEASRIVERELVSIDASLAAHVPVFLNLLSIRPWETSSSADELPLATITALTGLLLACGRSRPLVLMLDDWQWADGASTLVLGPLLRAIQDKPVMILVSARDVPADDPVLGQVPALRLSPFTETESMDAVRVLVSQPLGPSLVAAIHRRSGGNALFLEEICQSLHGERETYGEFEQSSVPGTVHDLIQARIERLDASSAELLRAASVIGNEFPRWLIETIDPTPGLDSSLASLLDEGLVHASELPGNFSFKHGIMREVVYQSVLVRERRELHGLVANALEAKFSGVTRADHYEELASHYAGACIWDRALEFAELAGDKAAQTSALDRARAHYAAALAHIAELPLERELRRRWLSIVAKWCATCVFSPTRDQLQVLERAARYAEELQDFGALANVEYWMGWIHYALGEQEQAIEHSTRALALAERAHHEPLKAQLLANLGQSHAAAGVYAKALEYLDNAIQLKQTRAVSVRRGSIPTGYVYAVGCRALVQGDQGHFESAYSQLDAALAAIRDTGHAIEGSLLCQLGMIQLWQGSWQAALETAARGRATGERVNGPYVMAICQTVGSTARWILDRRSDALDDLRRAVSWLERREIRLYLSFAQSHLAEVLLDAGDVDVAERYARRALERAEHGDPLGEASARRVIGRLELRAGRCAETAAQCERALEIANTRASTRELALTRLVQGQLHSFEGRHEEARRSFEGARDSFDAMHMNWHRAEAARLLSAL